KKGARFSVCGVGVSPAHKAPCVSGTAGQLRAGALVASFATTTIHLNDEVRNSNDEINSNDEWFSVMRTGGRSVRHSGFVIDSSFGLRHSEFAATHRGHLLNSASRHATPDTHLATPPIPPATSCRPSESIPGRLVVAVVVWRG